MHLIGFQLMLCHANVSLCNTFITRLLCFFCRNTQQVQCTAGVAVLLSSNSGAEGNHAVVQSTLNERTFGALTENVLELNGIVWIEDNIRLSKS